MVTSNDKWFNEIDGEQAFPFLGKTRESGMPWNGFGRLRTHAY